MTGLLSVGHKLARTPADHPSLNLDARTLRTRVKITRNSNADGRTGGW